MLFNQPQPPFYQFLREERQFCAVLAHLLMQKGGNLRAFIELLNSRPAMSAAMPGRCHCGREKCSEGSAVLHPAECGIGKDLAQHLENEAACARCRGMGRSAPQAETAGALKKGTDLFSP